MDIWKSLKEFVSDFEKLFDNKFIATLIIFVLLLDTFLNLGFSINLLQMSKHINQLKGEELCWLIVLFIVLFKILTSKIFKSIALLVTIIISLSANKIITFSKTKIQAFHKDTNSEDSLEYSNITKVNNKIFSENETEKKRKIFENYKNSSIKRDELLIYSIRKNNSVTHHIYKGIQAKKEEDDKTSGLISLSLVLMLINWCFIKFGLMHSIFSGLRIILIIGLVVYFEAVIYKLSRTDYDEMCNLKRKDLYTDEQIELIIDKKDPFYF